MSPFITFQDSGRFFILQTTMPYYTCEVIRGDRPQGIYVCGIAGYRIWIVFRGALQGNMVMMDSNLKGIIQATAHAMSDFYLAQRINAAPEKFKKWVSVN